MPEYRKGARWRRSRLPIGAPGTVAPLHRDMADNLRPDRGPQALGSTTAGPRRGSTRTPSSRRCPTTVANPSAPTTRATPMRPRSRGARSCSSRATCSTCPRCGGTTCAARPVAVRQPLVGRRAAGAGVAAEAAQGPARLSCSGSRGGLNARDAARPERTGARRHLFDPIDDLRILPRDEPRTEAPRRRGLRLQARDRWRARGGEAAPRGPGRSATRRRRT